MRSPAPILLPRDAWRAAVFARDGGLCVLCGAAAEDAHHIVERRLWPDSGYYLENGVSLCDRAGTGCHRQAERTLVSCAELRAAAGISLVLLPPHFELGEQIDKWGNILGADGSRYPGELFYSEQVQKVLAEAGLLERFIHWVRYPRTYHLPSSPGATSDDKRLESVVQFEGQDVVATLKLDGECTTLYRAHLHARSLDSGHHASRAWVKHLHAQIAHDIPPGWRICGENMFAKHAIAYERLPSYFFVFSIWNERNEALSWAETVEWCSLLGLETVPVFYTGRWPGEESLSAKLPTPRWSEENEGFVVRVMRGFAYGDFRTLTGKWVRAGHVPGSSGHWATAEVIPNRLR